MKWIFTSFCFFFSLNLVFAQAVLKGVVQNTDSKAPVPAASIFLANTSIGTTANTNGQFTLNIPTGKFDLIVSSVGYETYTQTITSPFNSDFISINLQPKAKELDNVRIEPFEKDGWEKWGQFFVENFVGFSAQ